MIVVISPTEFIQLQFAFETKKNSGSYKTHQAPTKKIFFLFFSLLFFFMRHREKECLWLLNSLKRGQKFVYKRFANHFINKIQQAPVK